ncbi:MAG: flagellar hook-length control protein FliK [Alphaproteobacteria bacterium]|nr:MAG: flagellar hook-length control protein FliK [Alphaproteobacteria bacterium]
MNPIDHMTQSSASAASQALAALIGGAGASKPQGAAPTAGFADALNGMGAGTEVAHTQAALPLDYVSSFGALVPALSTVQPTTAAGQLSSGQISGHISGLAGIDPQLQVSETLSANAASLSPAALTVELGTDAVNFAAPALSAPQGPGAAAAPEDAGHLLPIGELTALIDGLSPYAAPVGAAAAAPTPDAVTTAPETAVAAAAAVPTAKTVPVSDIAANATAGTAAAAAAVPSAPTAPAMPVPAAGATSAPATDAATAALPQIPGLPRPAVPGEVALPDALPAGTAAMPGTPQVAAQDAKAPVAPPPADGGNTAELAALMDPATADDAAALALANNAATAAADAEAGAADQAATAGDGTADGYVVPAQNAQQQAKAAQQPAGRKTGAEQGASQKIDTHAAAKTDTVAGKEGASEQLTSRAVDPVTARAEGQAAQQSTQAPVPVSRDPQLALTPERLAGLPESSSHDAVAAGLSSLRGQPSFMDSMSLMGGRPSPTFAANVAQQFNLQVSKAVSSGEQQFIMRLDPAELGRVEVKLHFTKDGEVRARVTAERPETLELLQRDAKGLEKALTSGGQKVDQGGISFSLDNSGQESAGRAFAEAIQQEKMRDELAARSAMPHGLMMDTAEEQVPLENILPHVTAETGLDIRV